MKPKLNINKIESYSQAVAEKICYEVFSIKKNVTGNDILKLTSVEQVNFFVLKNLFDKWLDEQNKLKSPYFNYENDKVKNALQALSIELSNNILIEKEFLKPLLVKSIGDTILWAISPKLFLENSFENGFLNTLEKLKASTKYFKINKSFYQNFTAQFAAQDAQEPILESHYQSQINKALVVHENQLDDTTPYIEKFGEILSFDLKDLYESIQKNNMIHESISNPSETNATSFHTTENQSQKPIEEKPIDLSNTIPTRTVLPPDPIIKKDTTMLNDQFSKPSQTLNDILALHQKNSSVNEKLAKTKIHDLRSAIALNKRFQIINELFKGNTGEYLFAIEDIENALSHSDAIQILQEKFAYKYDWTFEDELLKEFLELIERRFM